MDTKLKNALLNEIFEDVAELVKKIEVIHEEQKDMSVSLSGLLSDATNDVADKLFEATRYDIEKAGVFLEQSKNGLTANIDVLNKMGSTIQGLTKKLEKEKAASQKTHVIIAISVFVITSLLNTFLFWVLSH